MAKPIWTTTQVSSLAPDQASIKAGRKLVSPTKWPTLAYSETALWGECQGSGKKPYQVIIDTAEPAFKCSCPSRKFPCKHALALAYMQAETPDIFKEGTPPAWASEWLEKRQARKEKAATKPEKELDEATLKKRVAAQQRALAKRIDKVDAGVVELQRWLEDSVRQGLASRAEDTHAWHHMSKRMIDAQASGVASWLKRCAFLKHQLPDEWQPRLLEEIGRLYLLLQAWQERETLPEALQADVQTLIGFPFKKEQLLDLPATEDTWQFVGQAHDYEERITMQRTWLYSPENQRFALLIDYAALNQSLPLYPHLGTQVKSELTYYPSALPLRAAFRDSDTLSNAVIDAAPAPLPSMTISEGFEAYARALAQLPWLFRIPLILQATPLISQKRGVSTYQLIDQHNASIPLDLDLQSMQRMLAISGGQSVTTVGEWDGYTFKPLSLWPDEQGFSLAEGAY